MTTRFIVLISLSGQRLRLAAAPTGSCSSGLPAPIDGRRHLALPHGADAEWDVQQAPAGSAGYPGRKDHGRHHQAGHAALPSFSRNRAAGASKIPGTSSRHEADGTVNGLSFIRSILAHLP
jgi:hypothetical protein